MSSQPSAHLKKYFKRLGACQHVDFSKYINMSTDKDWHFGETQELKDFMDRDKAEFISQLEETTVYAKSIHDEVIHQKKNFNFDLAKNFRKEQPEENKFELHFKLLENAILASAQSNQNQQHIRNYNFDKITQPYKKVNLNNTKEVRQAISLKHIDMIGEPEFEENCRHYDDYYEIIGDLSTPKPVQKEKDANKQVSSEKELIDYLRARLFVVSILKPEQGIKIAKDSDAYNINYIDDMNPYRVLTAKIDIPSNIYGDKSQISQNHLFCFAGKGYSADDLQNHLKSEKVKVKQQQKLERENMLEIELQEIKTKIQILKDKKRDRNRLKFDEQMTQTERIIRDESIKDFIELEDKILLFKIEKLVAVKDNQIKKGMDPKQVYEQTHPMIKDYLFQLLMMVAAGESFIEWGSFLMVENHEELQKRVLKILYNNLAFLEGSRTYNDGSSKIQLLAVYSRYKLMVENQEKEILFKKDVQKKTKMNISTKFSYDNKQRSHSRSVDNTHQVSKHRLTKTPTKSPNTFQRPHLTEKSPLRSTKFKPMNSTTNQNINSFNRSKNLTAMENMEKRINRLFMNDGTKRKSLSKNHSRSVSKTPPTYHQQSINYPVRVSRGKSPHSKSISWK